MVLETNGNAIRNLKTASSPSSLVVVPAPFSVSLSFSVFLVLFVLIAGVHKHATITSLIQLCLFPRCCVTANDAIYCAKFLYILHNLRTPNFSSLICYDRVSILPVLTVSQIPVPRCVPICSHQADSPFYEFLVSVSFDYLQAERRV